MTPAEEIAQLIRSKDPYRARRYLLNRQTGAGTWTSRDAFDAANLALEVAEIVGIERVRRCLEGSA